MATKNILILAIAIVSIISCQQKRLPVVTPWGTTIDPTDPTGAESIQSVVPKTLDQLVSHGELIAVTMSAADTYYEYRSSAAGEQYMRCLAFARSLGLSLRIDVVKDTTQLFKQLSSHHADIALVPKEFITSDNHNMQQSTNIKQWLVASDNQFLADAVDKWSKTAEANRRFDYLPNQIITKNRNISRNPVMGRRSDYDHLFQRYAPTAQLNAEVMAAVCRQESAFNPNAVSWAGACGLMQIMPQTAARYGISHQQLFVPEHNVATSAHIFRDIASSFTNIKPASERILFVLAAYNAGVGHIKDAMALARHLQLNPYCWNDVARALALLQQPRYYQLPFIKHGYVRASETLDYVSRISSSANLRVNPKSSSGAIPRRATHKNRFAK